MSNPFKTGTIHPPRSEPIESRHESLGLAKPAYRLAHAAALIWPGEAL